MAMKFAKPNMASGKVRTIYDFDGDTENGELTIKEGDVLTVLRQDVGEGWWEGVDSRGQRGLFPAAYVELLEDAPPSRPPPMPPAPGGPKFSTSPSISVTSVGGGYGGYPPQQDRNDGRLDSWEDDWDDRSSASDSVSGEYNFSAGTAGRTQSVSRTGTVRKSMNRFSTFVKSGGESFLLGSGNDISVQPRDRISIIETNDGVAWEPSQQPFTCEVIEPEKKSKYKGMKSYITYALVPTHTNKVVSHRFKHFDWLCARLIEKYPCISVPALPDKQLTGRYAEDFIKKRRILLERWINRIARHPVLAESEVFQHFILCDSESREKEWKAGKRKAECDKLVGASFFHTIQTTTQNMSQQKVETQVEQFKDFVKVMDDGLKLMIQRAEDHWDKVSRSYKNEYKRFGYGLNVLSSAFAPDSSPFSLPLTQAIEHTGKMYDEVGEMCQEQPKKDILPMLDMMREYQGILATYPDIIQVHKGAMGKVKDCQKLQEEDKMEYTAVAEVTSRLDTVTNTMFAEVHHFHRERTRDFKQIMTNLLQEQISFHQQIIDKFSSSLDLYNLVPD